MPRATPESRDEHQNHERDYGQHVAGEHGSAHGRHEGEVGQYDGEKCGLRGERDSRPGSGVRYFFFGLRHFYFFFYWGRTQHGQQARQGEEVETEVSEELPEPHYQGYWNAERIEGGGDVVAKEFGIAEQETRLRVVIGVPGGQRHDGK